MKHDRGYQIKRTSNIFKEGCDRSKCLCINDSSIHQAMEDYHEHMISVEPKILYADVVKKQAMIKVLEALGDHKLTSLTVLDSLAETEEEILELLGLI